jgi:N-acetylmuramoyl-L-alanine amidase
MTKTAIIKTIIVFAILFALGFFAGKAWGAEGVFGKLIALDAGHGGTETGAINITYGVAEKDVNLDVVLALKARLEAAGAYVVLTREGDETISSRKERVNLAIEKCENLAGRKCDVLVSIHHNGSSDPSHNGTLVIYNEKKDVPLATALHDSLVPLTGIDEGYLNGGYGVTVYGNLVSALTEAYYITNDSEAAAYLAGTRVGEEVEAQFQGLNNYFNAPTKRAGNPKNNN